MNEPGDDPVNEPDMTPKASARHSRRRFLAIAGTSAVGAGLAFGVGIPAVRRLTRPAHPRVPEVPGGSLRIDHVTVIDPVSGSRHVDASILVRDGRILSVGPSDARSDDIRTVIDGAGRFAVPGYNNMHTHALQSPQPALMLATMLAEGVTGMRQMAGTDELLRDRAQQRLPLGPHSPRLLSMSGPILTPFNAGTVEDVQREIDAQFDAGADFVKMVLTERDVFFAAIERAHDRGMRVVGHLPESVLPSEASAAGFDGIEHFGASTGVWIESSHRSSELRNQADTSLPFPGWVAGLPFVEDIVTAGSERTLLNPAAFDSEESVGLLRDAVASFDEGRAGALADTFADDRTWHTPTLVRLRTQYLMDDPAYRSDPWLARMSAEARAEYEQVRETFSALPAATRDTYRLVYKTALRFTRICLERAVPLMAGTDGQGKVPGQRMALEFGELAAAGIPPVDILRMATTAPAQFLGRSATMGVIAPGADADLLLLGSDPLTDATHLNSISAVIRNGHHLTSEQLTSIVDDLAAHPEPPTPGAARDEPATAYACC